MPASKCDPILKEAFRGIELNYKLNSTISSLPKNQKFNAEQLEGYLKKQSVSPYEIKASRLFDNFIGDNRAFTAAEWDGMNLGEQMFDTKKTDVYVKGQDYARISLNRKGVDDDSKYRVKEFMASKSDKSTNLRHKFGENDYDTQSQLGWNRVHQDEINGKPTTVLNELQSDWMQAERQGAGLFESKGEKIKNDLKEIEKTYDELNKLELEYRKQNPGANMETIRNLEAYKKLNDKLIQLDPDGTLTHGNHEIIADFPMKPEKFQQLMIVDAINESIENGTNRVVIPIQRENELAGTAGVTEFYESLYPSKEIANQNIINIKEFRLGEMHKQVVDGEELTPKLIKSISKTTGKDLKSATKYEVKQALEDAYQFNMNNAPTDKEVEKYIKSKMLPEIQKKLNKQGLDIKLSREKYEVGKISDFNAFRDYFATQIERFDIDSKYNVLEDMEIFENEAGIKLDSLDNFKAFAKEYNYTNELNETIGDKYNKNELHVIEVVQKPNTPVRWDVYGLIAALGLTDTAIEMSKEEN